MMGPMAPPQAAPAQPQVLNVKNTPDQRLKFKDYMRGISSPPMPAPAPIMPMLPAPNPIDQVDIFDPVQGMASGGVVGGLEDLGKMSDQMVEALNTVVYGGGQGGGMGSVMQTPLGSLPPALPNIESGVYKQPMNTPMEMPSGFPFANSITMPQVGGNMAPQNQMTKDFGGQRMTGDMEMYRQAQDDARRQREGGFMGRVVLPGEMSYEDFMGMRPGQEIAQLFEDGGDVTAFARGGPAGLAEDERSGFSFDGSTGVDPTGGRDDEITVGSGNDNDGVMTARLDDITGLDISNDPRIVNMMESQRKQQERQAMNAEIIPSMGMGIDYGKNLVSGAINPVSNFVSGMGGDLFGRGIDILGGNLSASPTVNSSGNNLGIGLNFVKPFARGGPAGLAEDERAGFSFDGGGSDVIGGSNDTNSDNQDSFDSGSNNDEDPIEYMMTGKPLEAVFENTVTDLLNTVDKTKNDMIERIPDNSPYKAGVEVEAIPKAIDAVNTADANDGFIEQDVAMSLFNDLLNPLGELMGSKVSYGGRETNVLKDLERRADPSKNKPFGDMSIPGFGNIPGIGSALSNVAGNINANRAGKYLDQIANQGASAVRDPKTGMVVGYVGEGILGGRSYSGRAGYNPLGTGAVLDPLTNSYTVPFDDGSGDMFRDDDPLPSVLKPVEEEDEIVLPPLDIQPPAPVVPNDPVDVVVPSPRRPVDVSVPVVGYPELPQNILDLLNLYNNQPVSSFADGGAVLDTAAGNFLQALRSAA